MEGRTRYLPRLREWRVRRGLSQRELAEKSGVGRDNITRLEGGQHAAFWTTIGKLAAALDVRPDELIEANEAAA